MQRFDAAAARSPSGVGRSPTALHLSAILKVAGQRADIRSVIEVVSGTVAALGGAAAIYWANQVRGLRRELTDERLRRAAVDTSLARLEDRMAFDTRVDAALAIPTSEPEILSVTLRALEELLPDAEVSFLLAHGGEHRVRFSITLRAGRLGAPELVNGPDDCAALVNGRTMVVATNRALDACPHVAEISPEFEVSSLCVPLLLDGTALGVLHARGPAGDLVDEDTIARVGMVAHRAGERLWRVRAQHQDNEDHLVSDPVTGLPTRAGLDKRVREVATSLTPFCIVHCDIDGFTDYNERHGWEAGNRALKLFGQRLHRAVRPGDLVARIGNDEFAVMLADCSPEGAAAAMERVRERLVLSLTETGLAPFTYSAGIAPSDLGSDLDGLLDRAELAAEAAFLQGGNRVLSGEFD